MDSELLINVTLSETRVAYIDAGVVQEVHIEHAAQKGIVGNIYKGRISRVLPGMQAAFVDIGLERTAFLHAADIMLYGGCVKRREPAGGMREEREQKREPTRGITELVSQGQYLLVQVVKEPLGGKGARVTTNITLPSRYLVLIPGVSYIGISQRIEDETERERLKILVANYGITEGGFIIRTAAEGASERELAQDVTFLHKLWQKIVERKQQSKRRCLLYEELALASRVLRDFSGEMLQKIRVDSRPTYELLLEFTTEYIPELVDKLEYYSDSQPIFTLYNTEREIQQALERKVNLTSGGYLIIEQTEAMATIDINTGAFVGYLDLQETIFNTNIEATQAIARQLRLRNLGGIIMIDFIDMESAEHRQRVLEALQQALVRDRVKTSFSDFSPLGLVEMTRKRTRKSLGHLLCESCLVCQGSGTVKKVATVCHELMREIMRIHHAYHADQFQVYASTEVSEALSSDQFAVLAEVERLLGKPLKVVTDPQYHQDQFDVIMA